MLAELFFANIKSLIIFLLKLAGLKLSVISI